jgi:hypothetical protein
LLSAPTSQQSRLFYGRLRPAGRLPLATAICHWSELRRYVEMYTCDIDTRK